MNTPGGGRVIVRSLGDPKEMCWLDLVRCRGQGEGVSGITLQAEFPKYIKQSTGVG